MPLTWNDLRLAVSDARSDSNPDVGVFELFHENSKLGRYSSRVSDESVLHEMGQTFDSLPYLGRPRLSLAGVEKLLPTMPLHEAVAGRRTARTLADCEFDLEQIATLMHFACGISLDNSGTEFPRPLRMAPSAGALYPIEIYVYSSKVRNLDPGLYHFNARTNDLALLSSSSKVVDHFSQAFPQKEVASAPLLIFLTAFFERSTFKYGDRGYRFALLEAGHVAQNLNLIIHSLGLRNINVGGYLDAVVDEALGIDGVRHSTVYVAAVGAEPK